MDLDNRILFVCIGNVDRSKAAEEIFTLMLKEQGFRVGKLENPGGFDYYVSSAGIRPSAPNIMQGSIQLTPEILNRANRIFSLEAEVTKILLRDYNVKINKIIPFYVEDGRSLIIDEQAQSLYLEFRKRLRKYLPRK